jgi:hypothetical protein
MTVRRSPYRAHVGHLSQAHRKWTTVIWIILAMLLIVAVAGLVVVYVAFPHRGEEMPHTPWVGEALRKGVKRLPTLDNQREHSRR